MLFHYQLKGGGLETIGHAEFAIACLSKVDADPKSKGAATILCANDVLLGS